MILLDLGGPGLNIEDAVTAVHQFNLLQSHSVLVVGEAWEIAVPESECLETEAKRLATYDALSGASCNVTSWGLSTSRRREAIAAAVGGTGGNLVAAIGLSFGAPRLGAVVDDKTPLLLLSPAPPGGELAAVADSRARALRNVITRQCGSVAGCRKKLQVAWSAPVSTEEYELGLALLGAARDTELLAEIARLVGAGGADSTDVTRGAFAATYRYGDGHILPNLIGYRAGTCSMYSGPGGDVEGVAALYVGVLRCPNERSVASVRTDGRVGCMVLAEGDLASPKDLASRWTTGASAIAVASYRLEQHAAWDKRLNRLLTDLPDSLVDC